MWLPCRARMRQPESIGVKNNECPFGKKPVGYALGAAFSDLYGLFGDHAGRSARSRQEDSVSARTVRQSGFTQTHVRLKHKKNKQGSARAGGRAGERRSARNHLD